MASLPEVTPDEIIILFDAIVTSYRLDKVEVMDPKELIVSARVDSRTIDITSSRINVSEFKPSSSLEILTSFRNLRRSVQQYGIFIKVTLQDRLVGIGKLHFPYNVSELIREDMNDIIHSEVVKVNLNGQEVGQVEMLCRLTVKCGETQGLMSAEKVDCQSNVERSINPQDIMFVMGTACPTRIDTCQNTLIPNDGDEQLQQELLRYQRINMQTLTNTDFLMHNAAVNAASYEVKQMSPECADIVDAVTGNVNTSKPLPHMGNAQTDVEAAPADSSYGGANSFMPVSPPAKDPISISEWSTPLVKPIRFCPICLTSMSWLPKFAACPMCGVKPMPVVDERHMKKKLTADQILIDCLGKSKENEECVGPSTLTMNGKRDRETNKVDPDRCRCTCRFDKECAHCRIRKLCTDMFKTDEYPNSKNAEPQNLDDYCMIGEDHQKSRPHLARVFSELREMYSNVEPKPNTESSSSKRLSKIYSQKKPDPGTRRPSSKGAATINKTTTLMGGKLRTASEHKRAVEKRVGHKECLKRETQVPRRHGWAWQSSDLTVRYGWTPGSIWRPIRKLMKFFLQPDESTQYICNKQLKESEEQHPTLNVYKKNGKIFITLRPLYKSNPATQPITFQITKSDKAVTLRQIKSKLKAEGFDKCRCHKSLMMCVCRNQKEKCQLANALDKECSRRGIASLVNDLVLTDTSDSEMEYNMDVTIPVATEKDSKKVPKLSSRNFASQTSKADQTVPPKYPIEMNPMKRAYNCATANRFMNVKYFGAPGENLIADGRPFGPWAFLGGRSKVSNIWGLGSGGPGGFYRPGGLPRLQGCYETGGPGAPGGFSGTGGPGAGGLFGLDSPDLPCDPNLGKSGGRSKHIPVRLPKRLQKKPKDPKPPEIRTVDMMKYVKSRGKVPPKQIDYKIAPPFFEGISHRGMSAFGAGTEYYGTEYYGSGDYGQCRNPCYLYRNNPCCYP